MTETTPADPRTMAELPGRAQERWPEHEASRFLHDGEWRSQSYAEAGAAIREIALGLRARGIAAGDRVALLCTTRMEWTLAAYGITVAGAVLVPIYPTNSPRECEWVLADSGARAVICEDAGQAAKVTAVRAALPALEHVVLIAPDGDADTLDGLRAVGRAADPDELTAVQGEIAPGDPYTIIYTSGTTGPPKGVVLSHANVVAACRMIDEIGLVEAGEVTYLFLPLAHVFAQTTVHGAFVSGTCVVYFGGDSTRIVAELAATRPTYLPSVPRIFEKLYGAAMAMRAAGDETAQARFDAAVAVGLEVRGRRERGEPVPPELAGAFEAADSALFARIRGLFGGQVTRALSGAAPIAPEILRFFTACGVLVLEAWGLTETVALGTISTVEDHRLGTVGRAWPEIELRIAPDGEVLMRGSTVFAGYWNNATASAEAIRDGWFHTGDLGALDADGYLTITGRKKDIIITAGGKNLSPANLENDLARSPFISQAVMHGDRRPYPVALITLDAEAVGAWARERGLPPDPARLATTPEVTALVQAALDEANAQYAPVEQIKRFAILPQELSIEAGELTPTLKIKRAVVHERYATELDRLYD